MFESEKRVLSVCVCVFFDTSMTVKWELCILLRKIISDLIT